MSGQSDQDKLTHLATRIREAEARANGEPPQGQEAESASGAETQGGHIGMDMLATLLASMFLGWVFDRGFGTEPWGLIAMIPIGFAIMLVNIWRVLAQPDKDGGNDGGTAAKGGE